MSSSFDVLHQLDQKLQKSKSEREKNQSKVKESKSTAQENRKRSSHSPNDNDNKERSKHRSRSPLNRERKDSKQAKSNETNKEPPVIELDNNVDYDIPERSLGDFFCKLCDAHMNSENAWEAHIQGKRHLKNLKNGDQDLKYDTLDQNPIIYPELRDVDEPIVGLNHCCEYQRLEGRPIYQCFLCSANVPTGKALIDHLTGTKHLMAYLKEHDTEAYTLITNADLKKGMLEPVIRDYADKHRKKHGLGKMQVKKERPKKEVPSFYKSHKDDFLPIKRKDDRRKEYFERDNFERERDSSWRRMVDSNNDSYRRRSITPPSRSYTENYPMSSSRKVDWRDDTLNHSRLTSSVSITQRSPHDNYYSSSAKPISSYTQNDSVYNSHSTFPSGRSETVFSTPKPLTSALSLPTANRRNEIVQESEGRPSGDKDSSGDTTYIKKIFDILNSLPTVVFLELVHIRVKQMEQNKTEPSEAELSLLKTVGNLMISIVMNQKLNGLSPEMFSKFVDAVKRPQETTEKFVADTNSKSSNLGDLMNLISQLKQAPMSASTSSNNYPYTDSTQTSTSIQSTQRESRFSLQLSSSSQNLWNQPSTSALKYESRGIPGLTLSESSNETPYQQFGNNDPPISYPSSSYYQKALDPIGTKPAPIRSNAFATQHSSWPTRNESYNDYNNRY